MLEHFKWNLWHGKVPRALEITDELAYTVDGETAGPSTRPGQTEGGGRLGKKLVALLPLPLLLKSGASCCLSCLTLHFALYFVCN
jgi:hypothetical protein